MQEIVPDSIGFSKWNPRKWLPPILVFLLFMVLWQIVPATLGIAEYLVPSPSEVFSVFYERFDSLLHDTLITSAEALLGFMLANVLSILAAIGFSHVGWFERSFYPYMIALKSVPIIAVAPLLILWFGYGFMGKVVMAAIIAFFPLVVNATLGLKSVDPHALDLMRSLSASQFQILRMLRFPHALPYIFSALKISSTMAVVGAIIAEMMGASEGLGFTVMIASMTIDTPLLFAAIIAASLTGILFFASIVVIEALLR